MKLVTFIYWRTLNPILIQKIKNMIDDNSLGFVNTDVDVSHD